MKRAIRFESQNTSRLVTITKGVSSFKTIDEFWTDFTPDDGEKTTAFAASVLLDTVVNMALVLQIQENAKKLHELDKWTSEQFYKLLSRKEYP